MTAPATKMSFENNHLGNGDYVVIIASSSSIVDKECCKWTGRRTVEVNVEDERFTVVCSLCC